MEASEQHQGGIVAPIGTDSGLLPGSRPLEPPAGSTQPPRARGMARASESHRSQRPRQPHRTRQPQRPRRHDSPAPAPAPTPTPRTTGSPIVTAPGNGLDLAGDGRAGRAV